MESGINSFSVSSYSAGTVYEEFEIVESGTVGRYYVSRSDNNLGNGLSNTGYWLDFANTGWNFNDVWMPSFGTAVEVEPETNDVIFGDGYHQVVEFGVIFDFPGYQAVFDNVSKNQAKSLMAFFEYKDGAEPFWFQDPHFFNRRLFVCKSFGHEFNGECVHTVNALFEPWDEQR